MKLAIVLFIFALYFIVKGIMLVAQNAELHGIAGQAYELYRNGHISKVEYDQITFLARQGSFRDKALAWELYNQYLERTSQKKLKEAEGWI